MALTKTESINDRISIVQLEPIGTGSVSASNRETPANSIGTEAVKENDGRSSGAVVVAVELEVDAFCIEETIGDISRVTSF